MNVMLRTVDKAADAPSQAELISETLARFAHDLRAEPLSRRRCASGPST